MSTESKWLLVGLQSTGKTSYLAGLWHQLEAQETQTALRADALQPDRAYLNSIRDSWLALEPVPRTSRRTERELALRLRVRDAVVNVEFPDPSGEALSRMWSSRRATKTYARQALDTDGILLFVHPQKVKGSVRMSPREDSVEKSSTAKEDRWTPDAVSTQVQLVDLLQITLALRESSRPLPVSAIVSAWDLVPGDHGPESWFRRVMPMLWQFLSAAKPFSAQYFGVSAQGGDFLKDKEVMAMHAIPDHRVLVRVGLQQASHDLTLPLLHLLEANKDVVSW